MRASQYGDAVLNIGTYVSPTSLERARREVGTLVAIHSPYIPRQIDFKVAAGNRFVVIEEYITSCPLGDCFDRFSSSRDALVFLAHLVKGLRILWDQRIVHRALKPDNILVRPNGIPVNIDLGIARLLDAESLTQSHAPPGPCTPVTSLQYRRAGDDVGRPLLRPNYPRKADGDPLYKFGRIRTIRTTVPEMTDDNLRYHHEVLARLVETSPFGVFVVDAQFRVSFVGAGARAVFAGIDPVIGRDFTEIQRIIWAEPFASEATAYFRHTLATGKPYYAPDTTERRANVDAVESYDWKVERLTLPDGSYGVVCHFYDATRLRLAE